MLSNRGTELTLEEATMVLAFMRNMANIVVASYLEKTSNLKYAENV